MDDWDWELLQDSGETTTRIEEITVIDNLEEEPTNPFHCLFPDESDGVFQANYFSIDSHDHYHNNYVEEGDSSDNPSWIDPSYSSLLGGRGERIRRSSSSNSDSSGPTFLHLMESHHSNCDFNGIENSPRISTCFDAQKIDGKGDDSGGDGGNGRVVSRSNVVWWRVPLEVFRYFVLKVGPVWSLSMAAAAFMGFIIIRRRYLYKMKHKTQGLQLKLILDDKKVSQFMSRAARLNEAFSVVKRVPMIRPSLPAPGLTPWPVMSMR